MTTVHPDYCPTAQNWAIEGTRLMARTLAALSRLLPPGTAIEGYYPNGCPRELTRMEGAAHSTMRVVQVADTTRLLAEARARRIVAQAARELETRPGANHTGNRRKWNRERILDMWAAGSSNSSIHEATGCPAPSICAVISRARQLKDPRAVYRCGVFDKRTRRAA